MTTTIKHLVIACGGKSLRMFAQDPHPHKYDLPVRGRSTMHRWECIGAELGLFTQRAGGAAMNGLQDHPSMPAGPLAWLPNAGGFPLLIANADVLVPIEAVAQLLGAASYEGKSVLLTTTVQQRGQYGELIDGRIHEKPLIMESIIGAGVCIIMPDVYALALDRKISNVSDLFNLAREKGLPFLTHDWCGSWADIGNPEEYRRACDDPAWA